MSDGLPTKYLQNTDSVNLSPAETKNLTKAFNIYEHAKKQQRLIA